MSANKEEPTPLKNTLPHSHDKYQSLQETKVWEECVDSFRKDLVKDSEVVWDGLENTSFWLGASETPRNLPEQFARRVFDFHCERIGVKFDKEKSGCEWWVQIKDHDGWIGFHWDKDEILLNEEDTFAHPQLATVTYLQGSGGAPTIITDHQIDPSGEMIELAILDSLQLSFPRLGKHLAFDGRFLHGVSPTTDAELTEEPPSKKRKLNSEETEKPDAKRITFLVNVWLDYVPVGLERLSGEVGEKMSDVRSKLDFVTSKTSAATDLDIDSGQQATYDLGVGAAMTLTFPTRPFSTGESHFFRLLYKSDDQGLIYSAETEFCSSEDEQGE